MVYLEGELPQRPLLQFVQVPELLDRQVLEALLFVDCKPKLVYHRVKDFGRTGSESDLILTHANFDIGNGLILDHRVHLVECVSGVLHEARVHLLPVEHDCAPCDVLGAFWVDLSLEGHLGEGDTVDVQKEGVCQRGIV